MTLLDNSMTNLERLCKGLGWQGGTIFQVSAEFTKAGLSKELSKVENLILMNTAAIDLMLYMYKLRVNIEKGIIYED